MNAYNCLWSRREISLRTKSRIYQAVVCSILLYGWEIWPRRVDNEKMLDLCDNDSIHRILRVRRRDCVPSVKLSRPHWLQVESMRQLKLSFIQYPE